MTNSLLLFYSINCGHCRMLLESIKRHDTQKIIKSVCIETLLNENKLPDQVHSVPAMLIVSENKFLYGKQVFDHLLLPGSGTLVQSEQKQNGINLKNNDTSSTPNSIAPNNLNNTFDPDEPLGFAISLNGMSDGFALIETNDNDFGNSDRMYNWTPIDDGPAKEIVSLDVNQEVRSKKELPSLSDLQEKRSLDLNRSDNINPNLMPGAISARN